MAVHHLDGHYFVNFLLIEYFLSFFLSFILFPFWNEKKTNRVHKYANYTKGNYCSTNVKYNE